MKITAFIDHHYRHFNAATLREAAQAYVRHLEGGDKMMVTLGGAMSTAELGLSLAEMIRQDKVHAITATGANLEEDLFNLVAHDYYERIPDWRQLTPEREKELARRGLNRVTDTCIPEIEAFRVIEEPMLWLWEKAAEAGERFLPHEFVYQLIRDGTVADRYQIDPADSWLVAACERDLPLFIPGWEDSTLGNVFVANVLTGKLSSGDVFRGGTEYLAELAEWYSRTTMGCGCDELEELPAGEAGSVPDRSASPEEAESLVGFFQIGGGISGDFPICVVPMIHQDICRRVPYWSYFCQISDATPSYGSYSGAIPTEKITWGKLDVDTPKFVIESDATIVAPLVFAYVLGW